MGKVLGIPVKDKTLGSTRTRYYSLLDNMPSGWTYERYSPGARGDVLYIQKTETPPVWKAIRDCQKRNIPIVYERDDFCKPWDKMHTKVMNVADACIAISEPIKKLMEKHTKTKVYHVFDGFDYDIQKEERVSIRDELKGVVTYGRWANIEAAVPYYKRITCKKAYVCDRPIKNMGKAKFIEWKLSKFKNKVSRYDVVIIIHANNWRKKYKDIGRVMVAMALGIPVIASHCIEAEKAYTMARHPEFVVSRPKDIDRAMKMLQSKYVRQKVSDDFWEYAWNYWRPELASKRLVEVFEEVIHAKGVH